jgi:hypothetical protein
MKFGYTQIRWSNLFDDSFASVKWLCVKVIVAYVFYSQWLGELLHTSGVGNYSGVYALINVDVLQFASIKMTLTVFSVFAIALYLSEKQMIIATMSLFIFGVLVFSVEETNGIYGRAGLLSLVFLAQSIAYLFFRLDKTRNLNRDRMQFTLQFVAAVYTLAAISKWHDSGLNWITDAPKIVLQIQKSYDYAFVTNGDLNFHEKGILIANLITKHSTIIQVLLLGALLLETFSFVILTNRKWAFFYGILLLCMHIGIDQSMNVFFPAISMPMLIFCLNPLFLFYALANNLVFRAKLSLQKQ